MKCAYCDKPITNGADWEQDLDGGDYHRECFLAAVEARKLPQYHQTIDFVLMGIEEETRGFEQHAQSGGLFYVEAFSPEGWVQASHPCALEVATLFAGEVREIYRDVQFRIAPLYSAVHVEVPE